jgi:hypothetical protein
MHSGVSDQERQLQLSKMLAQLPKELQLAICKAIFEVLFKNPTVIHEYGSFGFFKVRSSECREALALARINRLFYEAYRKGFIPHVRHQYNLGRPKEFRNLYEYVKCGVDSPHLDPPHGKDDKMADLCVNGGFDVKQLEARFEHVRNGTANHIVDRHFQWFCNPCEKVKQSGKCSILDECWLRLDKRDVDEESERKKGFKHAWRWDVVHVLA